MNQVEVTGLLGESDTTLDRDFFALIGRIAAYDRDALRDWAGRLRWQARLLESAADAEDRQAHEIAMDVQAAEHRWAQLHLTAGV